MYVGRALKRSCAPRLPPLPPLTNFVVPALDSTWRVVGSQAVLPTRLTKAWMGGLP